MYEDEYAQGASLFDRALELSVKSGYPGQQEQFSDVMRKAMEVLNQTARQLKREDLAKQNQAIDQDYQLYQQNPTKEHATQLHKDLQNAQKLIRKRTL